jgi:hypothetical protein
MDQGDVFFFNGSVVHGSLPNLTVDRFRRALIGHYITSSSRNLSMYYRPIHRFDGSNVEDMASSPDGGPCGIWVENGSLEMNLAGDSRLGKPE